PGRTNVWTSWTNSELSAQRNDKSLFDAETIYDARGQPSAIIAHKETSTGKPASKLVYQLAGPDPAAWQTYALTQTTNLLNLNLSGRTDFSDCNFLYFYVENTNQARL